MLKKLWIGAELIALVVVVVWMIGSAEAAPFETGAAELESVGALEFGPEGVLFAADTAGAAVYALQVGAKGEPPAKPMESITDLDEKIAAMLGTVPRDVLIKDMVVQPGTGHVYLSIMRGRGEGAVPVILRIAGDGAISEVDLDDIGHAKLALGNAPDEGAKLYSWSSRTLAVTDMEFIDGELYIAGLSNEEFASTLRRTPFPFDDDVTVTGLEIYHGAHGAYETFAPIFSFIPYEMGDEQHLLAGYLCTPLVTFPIDEIRTKERLRGKTLAELGWGNFPLDILEYEHGGERYVLIANNRRGTMKLKADDIAAAQKGDGITTEVGPRQGVDYHTVPLGNVVQIDLLDDDHIMVLSRDMENGSLTLYARNKRWL